MYKSTLILIIALLAIQYTSAETFERYIGSTVGLLNLNAVSPATPYLDANSFGGSTAYNVYVSPNVASYSGTKFFIERSGTNEYRFVETTAFNPSATDYTKRYLSCDFTSKNLKLNAITPPTGYSNRWAVIQTGTNNNYVFQCLPNGSEGSWYLNGNPTAGTATIVNSYDPAVNPGTHWLVDSNCVIY